MGKYENIFDKVGKARALTAWEPSLPLGKHHLALVKYGGKTSAKDKTVFLEAEFIVLSSANPNVRAGTRHSWPWFINKPDEYGYTHSRAKNFLEVLQKCIGNQSDTTAFGNALAEDFEGTDPEGFGIMVDAEVVQVMDASGNARRGKRGQEVLNVNWSSVVQDEGDIIATRARLVQLAYRQPQTIAEPSEKFDTETSNGRGAITQAIMGDKKSGALGRLINKQV